MAKRRQAERPGAALRDSRRQRPPPTRARAVPQLHRQDQLPLRPHESSAESGAGGAEGPGAPAANMTDRPAPGGWRVRCITAHNGYHVARFGAA